MRKLKYQYISQPTTVENNIYKNNCHNVIKLLICVALLIIQLFYKTHKFELLFREYKIINRNETKVRNLDNTSITLNTVDEAASPEHTVEYYVNTSHCHIPYVDPFTPKIRKIFKPVKYPGCSKNEAIVNVLFNVNTGRYLLHINHTVAAKAVQSNSSGPDVVVCCYREIVRSGSGKKADESFTLLPCVNFHQDFVVPEHVDAVIVDCRSNGTKRLLQQDAFSFIQLKDEYIRLSSNNRSASLSMRRSKLGILLIGIDSLSRINFRRTMPECFKYLRQKQWFELEGYNKIGDNTLPNLMALLAGYSKSTTLLKCKPSTVGGLDRCDFIWKSFKAHGYHTAYAEDTTFLSTFNYNMRGFENPPTDYYFRPMALAIERNLKKQKKFGLDYCIGRKQYGEYVYDFAVQFATRFQYEPHFGLFWTNSFSHNTYDSAATMDSKMLNYLQQLEERGILETSMVVFFSDHGRRWGKLLELPEGFLEERLPMFFISLPRWFRNQNPHFVRALKINRNRLTTPYDIHVTLQHLLKLYDPAFNMSQTYDCPHCQSVFEEVSENRTCPDAGIPDSWCTCVPYQVVSVRSRTVKQIMQQIISEMNKYLLSKNLSMHCSTLGLKSILSAQLRMTNDENPISHESTYMIKFTTSPKTKPPAVFSATAVYDTHSKSVQLNVEDIGRQSKYETTAKCIDHKQAKKYCICK